MKKTFILLAASLLFIVVGCVEGLHESGIAETSSGQLPDLTAGFAEGETKTYVESGKYLRWHEDDRLTAFFGNTLNRQYKFNGATGDNSGSFSIVSSGNLVTGNALDRIYAVYPYDETATITDDGQISMTLPAVQTYAENSFGRGANTMLAATENVEDTFLGFKNACGYLKLKFYNADGATIKSIEVKGNGEEKIAGAATATIAFGEAPQLTMADDATTAITLDCGEGVALGTTAETATEFWVVIPETTFEGGITITVTDTEGGIFEKSTTKKVVIERNAVQPMAALEVEFAPAGPANNEIWYTNGSATNSTKPYKTDAFGANIVSNLYDADKECWVIQFDSDVTKIGDRAFYECGITSITIPESVNTIGSSAFNRCLSLTRITIPDNVTSIGESAFYYCSSLTSLTLGKGVTAIGYSAFRECTGELIINCNIPSVDSSSGVFSGSKFKSVTIGDGVTTIGATAFYNCSSLTSVTIGNSVTSIGATAFHNCSSLTSVTIGNSVTSIGDWAFDGCSNLTSISIPCSVTTIGESAFNCFGLTSVKITDISAWCKIDFETIASNPLNNKANLYLNSELVTELVIPSDITEIKPYAFYSCKSLTSVTIPESVTAIGNYAFRGCSSLTSVYCKAVTPPTGAAYMFNWYSDAPNLKIYVPAASVSEYKKGTWSNFKSLIVGYDFE